jgi:predicted DsbA family dithiol-disulfide isomerase
MHQALFKAHWGRTARLEDPDDLARIGEEIGLDGAELRRAIDENRYAAVIDDNRRDAESVGINAIPAHIFGRRFLVLGAQPYEGFQHVLERFSQDSAAADATE